MAATLIDGKAVARATRDDVAREVAELVNCSGVRPGLATVLVGDDPASAIYVESKRRSCVEAGIHDLHHRLAADVPEAEVIGLLEELGDDPAVSGILLQLPVPGHLDGDALIARIPPDKDVDGLTAVSAGRLVQAEPGLRPCTPEGILALLDTYEVPLAGAEAVVVGRSKLVGTPVSQLLLQRHATVTVCHSRTRDVAAACRRADIVVAAAGVRRLLGADAIKPGATVIDVGIHRTRSGLCGDVDFDAVVDVAAFLTPVPGGVGPMTIALLLRNTVKAARLQLAATSVPT